MIVKQARYLQARKKRYNETKRIRRMQMSYMKAPVVLSLSVLLGAGVYAEQTVGIDVSADFFGKYVWRGQNLNDASVFQPGIGITYGGLTGSIWGSLDMTGENDNRYEFTEYDFSIEYSASLPGAEGVGFSVGAINYRFPSLTPTSTTEVYCGFNFELPLSPSVTVYRDVDQADGTYVSFGVGHSFEKAFQLSTDIPVGMEIGASVGWGDSKYNNFYWGVDNSKMNDLILSLSFPLKVNGWTISPSVNYVTLLSNDIRSTDVYDKKSDYVFAGVMLSRSF